MAARCATPPVAMHHLCGSSAPFRRWRCTIIRGQAALLRRRTQFDFYLQSHYDVYLLRLVNSTEKIGEICPAGKDGIIYIICRFPMQKATLSEDIETVLRALEPFGFPSLHNPKHGITFEIEG